MAIINKIKSLVQHQGFRRYAANTSWMMAEQMLRIIAGLLVGIWVARYLGPEQFGLFSYVLAFTAIFGGIAKLGLDGIMVRELVNHPEKRDTYLGTAFWLKILGAFLVMGIMAAIVPFTSNDATTNTFIFIIAAGLVFQSFEVVEFYFQSQVLAKIVSICKVIQLALSSMVKIYLVLTEAELMYFVLVTAFDALSLAVSYAIAYKLQKNPAFYKHFDFQIAKQLLKDSWPLIFSAIVVMIYMRIDQIMIKEMLGEYEVGIYSAAIRLSEAFYFIPTLIAASLFPAIVNAKKTNHELYMLRMQRLYTLMIWLAVAIALPMTFLSSLLVPFLFGEAYIDSIPVLIVHIWAVPLVFLLVVSGKWFIIENLSFMEFYRNLIAMIINIACNFALIPIYGQVGAALATLIAFLFSAYLFDVISSKTRVQFYLKSKAIIGKGLM
ncbi:flippase [Ectopseudomonas oleovorans]|uniref:flippase n=1 Tax=Ectopseudomonas oleovorans TaxID=301 RepID=UPI00241F52F9|nr:flippase [Pseudomonas oleovorans]